MLPFIAKGTFQNIVILKIWGWGDLPGLSRWALKFITWALIGGRQRETWGGEGSYVRTKAEVRVKCSEGETGATSQGKQAASRSWKRHRILPKSLWRKRSSANTLILAKGHPISDFWPPEL